MKTTTTTEISSLTDYHKLGSKQRPCLIVIAGQHLAQRYWLDRAESIIGRLHDCHIVLNEANVSRHHARIIALGNIYLLEDLDSTNGTYLNSSKLTEASRLEDGDSFGIGETIFKFTVQSAADDGFYQEVLEAARRDALTGLLSRQFFIKAMETEIARVSRYGGSVSLLMCDVDDFKQINDRYGHAAGDLVLQRLGALFDERLRQDLDVAGRYGGDELIVLLPQITPEQARRVADKLSAAVESLRIDHDGQTLSIGISVGVAGVSCPPRGEQQDGDARRVNVTRLMQDADRQMYRAKSERKKNRTRGAR